MTIVRMKRDFSRKLDPAGNSTRKYPSGRSFDVPDDLLAEMIGAGAVDPPKGWTGAAAGTRGNTELGPLPDNLGDMNKTELTELAAARGVDATGKTKAEIIVALQAQAQG